MKLGIEVLLNSKEWQERLKNKRVGFLGHPASVDHELNHSFYQLAEIKDIHLTVGFGPQHGMLGEKQDNMVESDDYTDPHLEIPVFSLYGEHRRPTPDMLSRFDVLLVDLQDVGARIYTFISTVFYFIEACSSDQEIWILDRPNPIGREIEGSFLKPEFESFVGASRIPMRHGLTLGEASLWFKDEKSYSVNIQVVKMESYKPAAGPGFGWPLSEISWVNPSPNVPRLSTTRVYPGSVMLEGTQLSEGRGSTLPLEMFGAPGLDHYEIISYLHKNFSQWIKGCKLRSCYFEPTFHKFTGELCSGLQVHVDDNSYDPKAFKPYRLMSAYFKSIRILYPNIDLWREPPYEYEYDRLPIDLITGSSELRLWVDDSRSTIEDFEKFLSKDEQLWKNEIAGYLLYE